MRAFYFTAAWCGPCKVYGPLMEKLKDEFSIIKVDIDENFEMAVDYNVMSVPTVVFIFDRGPSVDEIGRLVGARTEDGFREFVKELPVQESLEL